MPYQKRSGWVGSRVAGLKQSAPNIFPTLPEAASCADSMYRRDELEKKGTLNFSERAYNAIASVSVPATGLSMNIGLPALITSNACCRWGLPSLVSNKTKSTFLSSAAIESTISTPIFFTSSIYPGILLVEDSISALPGGYAATTRNPLYLSAALAAFKALVKAMLWEVSRPMMPILPESIAVVEAAAELAHVVSPIDIPAMPASRMKRLRFIIFMSNRLVASVS